MKISGFLLFVFMLLISCQGKSIEQEPVIDPSGTEDPKITAIQIDGFSCSFYGQTFSVELFANSVVDIKSVKMEQINFSTNNSKVKITPSGPFNFETANNKTITLTAELNGKISTYNLQVLKRKTDFSTWIMIWNGSSEGWWKSDSYNGVQLWINEKWQSVNWQSDEQTTNMVNTLKSAGINVIICDLTNVWPKFHPRVNFILKLCAQNGMKACIADMTPNGDLVTLEARAKSVYDNFAGPDAPYASAYFKKDGKPLIVEYIPRPYYNKYLNSTGEYRSKFTLANAGGENETYPDRWGWQYEFANGLVPSDDAMFVSSSTKYYPKINGVWTCWRKHLACLDFNFALARRKSPKNVIVGSFDDVHERNSWIMMRSANADERGMQTRNIFGVTDSVVYYNRVVEWINGTPSFIPGGDVADGAYRIGSWDNRQVEVKDQIGTLGQKLLIAAKANTRKALFYFYHLGNNEYRIVSLMAGLSVEPGSDDILSQEWDNSLDTQRWIVEKVQGGKFRLKNKATQKYMGIKSLTGSDYFVWQEQFTKDNPNQEWILEPGLTLSGQGFMAP